MRRIQFNLGGLLLAIGGLSYFLAFPFLSAIVETILVVLVLLLALIAVQSPIYWLFRTLKRLPPTAVEGEEHLD
jgi:hypothetical protein